MGDTSTQMVISYFSILMLVFGGAGVYQRNAHELFQFM